LTVRAYQVGFGDCFLLTWKYAAGDRNILIDFGSNGQPAAASKTLLADIAADIKTRCGGKLDAIVLTHRHKDHIAGFTTAANGKGPGDVIASLKPDVIVQPWTEDPKAQVDATEATADSVTGPQAFVASLANMQDVSSGVVAEARNLGAVETAPWKQRFLEGVAFFGEEGINNPSAVKNLQRMGTTHTYVSHGSKSGLESVLPGVDITVLGPPTLKQSSAVKKERSTDATEFWMFQAAAGRRIAAGGAKVFPRARALSTTRPPAFARWLVPRLRAIRGDSLLGIVRIMDDALNNTSVILLFEINGQAFLFPGDAQIENWTFTLQDAALMKRLAKVTFYKVGHHGSRNATPKTLWNNFDNRGAASKPGRLTTVVSTMAGKYGKLAEGTEVPRTTLVTALKADSDFFTTQSLKGKTTSKLFTVAL
jgi:hypothetical protein